jgi:hypothetical protein
MIEDEMVQAEFEKLKEVETAVVVISVFAEVQQNSFGTWTAVIPSGDNKPYAASTREMALNLAAENNSIKTTLVT